MIFFHYDNLIQILKSYCYQTAGLEKSLKNYQFLKNRKMFMFLNILKLFPYSFNY